MSKWLWLLILALACGGQYAFGSNERLQVSAQDNLRYQLDCIAKLIRCTKVRTHLREEITRNPAAARRLGEWRDVRTRLASRALVSVRSDSPLPPITDLAGNSGRQTDGARVLAPRAIGFDDPMQHQLIAYFSPIFQQDWRDGDVAALGRMKVEMQWLFERDDLRDSLTRIRRFLASAEGTMPTATLIHLPDSQSGSLATIDDNLIYLEVPRSDSAENRMPVLVHEYVHYWLSRQTQSVSERLSDAFADSAARCSGVAFGLFEEALAAALGNGLIEQQLSTRDDFRRYLSIPDSFYADSNVDALAKAILPLVADYVANSRSIDREFVDAYISLSQRTMNMQCESLALGMRTSAMVLSSPTFVEAGDLARNRWRTATMLTDVRETDSDIRQPPALQHYERLSGVVMTTADALDSMTVLPQALRHALMRIARQHDRFVFSWPRSTGAEVYVVVGGTLTATTNTMVQLIALRQDRFSGLWVPPALPEQSAD